MMEPDVILVNQEDEEQGRINKMEAHRLGLLHRAFSVFIFDEAGSMLLQQRAAGKYHGGLLWTNACCSHPYPGEEIMKAAERRLKEELGFVTPLKKIFSFVYRAEVENGLIEHEYDHVFVGKHAGTMHLNPEEVADTRFVSMEEIRKELEAHPEQFTAWFRIAFPEVEKWSMDHGRWTMAVH